MPNITTTDNRWQLSPFTEWRLANLIKELVHSSRVITEPEKEIPSPKQPE